MHYCLPLSEGPERSDLHKHGYSRASISPGSTSTSSTVVTMRDAPRSMYSPKRRWDADSNHEPDGYDCTPDDSLPPRAWRTVRTPQEWNALVGSNSATRRPLLKRKQRGADGTVLDEIATLDLTRLSLPHLAWSGTLAGVSTLRVGRALVPEEVPYFAQVLRQLPNLERLEFEGELDEMEQCAAEIMLYVNLRHNPNLSVLTVAFSSDAARNKAGGTSQPAPPPRMTHGQTWIALLALRWPAGSAALEHQIYAAGARREDTQVRLWSAVEHPLPMLAVGAPREHEACAAAGGGGGGGFFEGRMHVLRFLRRHDLRFKDARGRVRYHRVPRDRVAVYRTVIEDFGSVEDFLRDNLDDDEDADEDEDSEDEGFAEGDEDEEDLMEVDLWYGGLTPL